MISSNYTELRSTQEPIRRKMCQSVSWLCNIVAIVGGVYSILAYASLISMIVTAFYCFNIYILLGDYNRWQNLKFYVLIILIVLLAVNLVVTLIEYFFVFKAGYYNEKREGENIALALLWGSFVFQIAFLLGSYLTTYFLYPDQLALLSQEHPAMNAIVMQSGKSDNGKTSASLKQYDIKTFTEDDPIPKKTMESNNHSGHVEVPLKEITAGKSNAGQTEAVLKPTS